MQIEFTEKPVNQADQGAACIVVNQIHPADRTIKGDLCDSAGHLVAHGRVYSYAGAYKNIPFADLGTGQIAYLAGADPDDTWPVATIKLWLDDRQAKDDDGQAATDDPFYYPPAATKADLLQIVLNNTEKDVSL